MRRVKAGRSSARVSSCRPDQLRQSDQIASGRREGQRPIADEVNKLGCFDAEIHMRTSVSALAELMVRIHSPPAKGRVMAD
jgi:hypothetical protein